jgi:hypothetical protein
VSVILDDGSKTVSPRIVSAHAAKKIPAFGRGWVHKTREKFECLFAVRGGIDIEHGQRKQAESGNDQDQVILFGTGHGLVPPLDGVYGGIVPVKTKPALI